MLRRTFPDCQVHYIVQIRLSLFLHMAIRCTPVWNLNLSQKQYPGTGSAKMRIALSRPEATEKPAFSLNRRSRKRQPPISPICISSFSLSVFSAPRGCMYSFSSYADWMSFSLSMAFLFSCKSFSRVYGIGQMLLPAQDVCTGFARNGT